MAKKCPVMYAFNMDGALIAIRCGSWTCPHCMKANARQWSWRVSLHISKSGKPAYFWTLTLGRRYKTAAQGFEALPGLWDRFRKYIRRLHPGTWEYCAFVEGQPQRSNMPHFHIISLIKSPKRLKDVAVWSGFGYQAKEVKVNSAKAAAYVAKYASKQSEETPRGFRRVRVSQGWTKLPQKDGSSLIIRQPGERLPDYLTRVSELTCIPYDEVLVSWVSTPSAIDFYNNMDE